MTRLILGSQSPRRQEILGYFSVPFEQATPVFDEEAVPFKGDPVSYVNALALGKAHSLAAKHPQAIILTADTIVWRADRVYGKPKNKAEAFSFLSQLSGNWHSVFTGIALSFGTRQLQAVEETRVLFNSLSTAQINQYLETQHWVDKAGGYAIQQAGGLFVQKIDGCYYNVMGLPINSVRQLLMQIGLDLWDFLK